jgi:prepilin-type processing-associated H-X9-DG protein
LFHPKVASTDQSPMLRDHLQLFRNVMKMNRGGVTFLDGHVTHALGNKLPSVAVLSMGITSERNVTPAATSLLNEMGHVISNCVRRGFCLQQPLCILKPCVTFFCTGSLYASLPVSTGYDWHCFSSGL